MIQAEHETNHPAELLQASFVLVDDLDPILCLCVPSLQSVLERLKIRIKLNHTFFNISEKGSRCLVLH